MSILKAHVPMCKFMDNGEGMTADKIHYGLLGRGESVTPKDVPAWASRKIISHFATGHNVATAHLAKDGEVIIATVKRGGRVGVLCRHHLRKRKSRDEVMEAYLSFDLNTRKIIRTEDEDLADVLLAEASFGLCSQHHPVETGFPMRDVTEAKLCALFDDIRQGGTCTYFPSKLRQDGTPLMGPIDDGLSVRVGDKLLHDYLAHNWLLPPSAAQLLPWQTDCGLPLGSGYPFVVDCSGPAGTTRVDLASHVFEAARAAGKASDVRTILVNLPGGRTATAYALFAWVEEDSDAGIRLHRHPRFVTTLPLPYAMDGTLLSNGTVSAAKYYTEASGSKLFSKAHAHLEALCGGAFPISKADIVKLSKPRMRSLMGEKLLVIATSHYLTYSEGKEHFEQDEIFKVLPPALRYEAAKFALEHPRPDCAEQAARSEAARSEAARRNAQKGKAALKAARDEAANDPEKRRLLCLRREGLLDTDGGASGSAAAPAAAPATQQQRRAKGPTPLSPQAYGKDSPPTPGAKPRSAPSAKRKPTPAAENAAKIKRLKEFVTKERLTFSDTNMSRDALVAHHMDFVCDVCDKLE